MPYKNKLRELQTAANNTNISDALMPWFTTLNQAFPPLIAILKELRGDTTTSPEFQEQIIKVLDEEDCSAKTICGLMFAYTKTHNDYDAPNRKPIVALAQEIYKIISNIEDILAYMKDTSQHNDFLKNVLTKINHDSQ